MHKCAYIMFIISPDQKKDLCFSSIQIVLIKDKIRSLKYIFFCCCFIKPTIFLNIFSDFNKMAEKRKFSDRKTFGRPKFRTEKFSDKNFSVRKFSFLMYIILIQTNF